MVSRKFTIPEQRKHTGNGFGFLYSCTSILCYDVIFEHLPPRSHESVMIPSVNSLHLELSVSRARICCRSYLLATLVQH